MHIDKTLLSIILIPITFSISGFMFVVDKQLSPTNRNRYQLIEKMSELNPVNGNGSFSRDLFRLIILIVNSRMSLPAIQRNAAPKKSPITIV